jgi:prepilin-type processing-associated H-X9-DG protein
MLYADDHDGLLPPTSHSTAGDAAGAWIALLRPYIADTDAVRVCPADPLRAERAAAGASSYILNNIVFDPLYDPFGGSSRAYNNLHRLSDPSRTLLAGIVSEARPGVSPLNDHTHAESWDRGWRVVIGDIEPNRHRVGPSNEEKTNGNSNYLFADGHVETIDALALKQQFDRGINFAWPPEHTP